MKTRRLMLWTGFAAIIITSFGTLGTTVLTAQRQQIDAPLVASSQDIAVALNGGISPKNAVAGSTDMNQSLLPFSIIYGKNGRPIAGSGRLDGVLPSVPVGVLQASQGRAYSTVTWQPDGSLRYATATVSAGDYYVLTGSSLQVTEHSSALTEGIVIIGCCISLLILALLYLFCDPKRAK